MNRALRIAKLINSKLYGRCNILDLFKLFEDFEANKINFNAKEASIKQCDSQLVLHHPLLRELRLHCTSFAFNHLFYQFMHSHCLSVSSMATDPE